MTVTVKTNAIVVAGKTAVPLAQLPPTGLTLSRQELEFASHGRLSELFGPMFKQQDSYTRICRLPRPPMLLVDRVTGLAGEPGSMTSGIIWTETDVKADAWYLHHGRMPMGLVAEAGQADLLLISWLGADFLNRSERVYRLLGCELTFYSAEMPKAGETIRYQIHVDAPAQIGNTKLFHFSHDAYVGDRLLSSVRNGLAGFFSDPELAELSEVFWSAEQDQPKQDARLDPPRRLTEKRAFSTAEIEAFAQGDAFTCFGDGFEMAAVHTRTPNTDKGRLRLFDRIVDFDVQGGPWGRGYMRAECDVPKDAWFYVGHFHNDRCMPAVLIREAARQVLEFYMAALGFTIDRDGWIFGPITEEAYKFIHRGQITPDRAHLITYEVFIEEIVGGDRPKLYAALLAKCDGQKVFLARRFGVSLLPDWPLYERYASTEAVSPKQVVSPTGDVPGDYGSLLAFANGKPGDAFGSLYRHLDNGERMMRMPSPPYHCMSRIVSVDCQPGRVTPEGTLIAEYDVPPDAWYFRDSGTGKMPFAVLMEVVLQPSGWFANYMGFFAKPDLSFRNLDGSQARILQEVTPQTGTLSIAVTFKRHAQVGTMTIVFLTLVCRAKSGVVMTLDTSFGYFPPEALANQKGLPTAHDRLAQMQEPSDVRYRLDAASSLRAAGRAPLPSGQLDLIDEITGYWPHGGRAGLGRIRGCQAVDPRAWYFKAHFFQDPVQPGSIGIESLFILAKAAALLQKLDAGFSNPRFEVPSPSSNHGFSWKFRGQVLPTNHEVTSEVEISEIVRAKDAVTLRFEGSLWSDGIRIYEVQGATLRIYAGDEPPVRRERLIEIAAEPWLDGHCPTYRIPAFPMAGVVGALIATSKSASRREKLVSLEKLEISRWIRLDRGPVRLQFKPIRTDGNRQWIEIWSESHERPDAASGRIGRVIESYAADYPSPPAAWPGPQDAVPVPDPYGQNGYFHSGEFMRAEGMARDRTSSVLEVDIGSALKAANGDTTIFIDIIGHGVPYAETHLWFQGVPQGHASFPYRVETYQFFADLPTFGRARVVTRPVDWPTPRTPRCAVQVQYDGRVIVECVVLLALVPIPGHDLPARHWRDFLQHDRVAPGGHLARLEPGRTELSIDKINTFNWFPGMLERLYRISGDLRAVVEAVALKDHFGSCFDIHPGKVELEGEVVRIEGKVLNLSDCVRRRWVSSSVFEVVDIQPQDGKRIPEPNPNPEPARAATSRGSDRDPQLTGRESGTGHIGLGELVSSAGYEIAFIKKSAPAVVESGFKSRTLADDLVGNTETESAALSADSERFWRVDLASGGDTRMTINAGAEVEGVIDPQVMEMAIRRLVVEQPVLRRCYPEKNGRPISAPIRSFPERMAHFTDLTDIEPGRRLDAAFDIVRARSKVPFDVEHGPLFYVDIFRLGPTRHLLYVTMHHMMSDLRSLMTTVARLLDYYSRIRRGESEIEPIDVAPASGPVVSIEDDTESRAFWRQTLPSLDFTPLFSEPGEPARPLRPAGSVKTIFTAELWKAINLRAPKVVMLAAYRLLLAELSGRRNFVIGMPMLRVGRDDSYGIGFSGVPVLLQGGVDENWSIDELLADTRGKMKQATRYGHVSLTDIQVLLEQAGRTEIAHPSALFSVSLLPAAQRVGEFTIAKVHSIERAHTDFLFTFWITIADRIGEQAVLVEYDRSYFDRFDVQALLARYLRLLEILTKPVAKTTLAEIVAAPDRARRPRQLRLHVSANFTCDPIVEPLQLFANLLDLPLRIELGGYNQVLQDLQDPSSALSRNGHGANVVLLRLEDWFRDRADRVALLADPAKMEQQLTASAQEYASALGDALGATKVPLLVAVLPPSNTMLEDETKRLALARVEANFKARLDALRGIHVLNWDEAIARMPVATVSDELADGLGHVPYTSEAFAAIGAALSRRLHEIWRRPFKVIAVDCDNTLWRGVVGEDGVAGLVIDERHRRLQAALVRASRAGLLICLCSKNNEEEVLAVFRERSDMVLSLEHVVARRINWQPKSQNIRELASDLDLGLDSFVFLDDNPMEIDEVSGACPEVTAIRVPTDGPTPHFADHLWPLDRSHVTNEDEKRTELYRQATLREDERRRSTNYTAFLASLQLQVTIGTPQADAVERVAQLTGRTNQFNCYPEEKGHAEIQRRIADPAHTLKAIHVEDRFGSYGLVGVVGARAAGERLEVDTFLMSCRVLGRGIEQRMVNALGAAARERGLAQVAILFRSTGRNVPAERFLNSITEAKREPSATGGFAYVLTTEAALNLAASAEAMDVEQEQSTKSATVSSKRGQIAPVSGHVFAKIALEFASAEAVLRESTPKTRPPGPSANRADADSNIANQDPTGRDAARQNAAGLIRKILSDRFGLPDPDFSAPLWRLGLTSLKTVQFLAELRRTANVEIDVKDIHDAASLSDLARRLSELQEGGGSDQKSALTKEMVSADLVLPRDIVPTRIERHINLPSERRQVLLTGATGFLGGHLAAELIAGTDAIVRCIVRAPDEAAAVERLAKSLKAGGHQGTLAALGTRLYAVAGDLDAPHFGWSDEMFRAAAADIDLVLHNGALVDLMAPYPQLRGPNVLGTLHALAFADEASAPFHFVSTAAIFDAESWLGLDLVAEAEMPETADDILHGYAVTKWVSERHVQAARARGLPGSIYRPGNICGDSRSGVWPPGDAITRIVKAVFDVGALPDVPLRVDLTPVDYVARTIVTLAMMRPLASETYHVLNSRPLSMEELRRLTPEWQAMASVAPETWLAAVLRLAEANPNHPIAGFVPVLLERVGRRKLSFFEFIAQRPNFSDANTRRGLAPYDVHCPNVDGAMFRRFIAHWEACGHLQTRRSGPYLHNGHGTT